MDTWIQDILTITPAVFVDGIEFVLTGRILRADAAPREMGCEASHLPAVGPR